MLRSGAGRSLARSVLGKASTTGRQTGASLTLRNGTQSRVLSFKAPTPRPLVPFRPAALSIVRYSGHVAIPESVRKEDAERQARLANERMQPHPAAVSATSTTRDSLEGRTEAEEDVDMGAGIRGDIDTIKETFSLKNVPREALVVGMAGVVPYLATSLTTVFLAWDMNYQAHHGVGFIVDAKTAEILLHIIEPLQIGYGAVIISFLGAIHWGLEWGRYGGTFGYKRYWPGVLAPAIAWPTTLMPYETALITQFLAFNWLYFNDSNAASSGLAPSWYGIYRFVLTFVVGASIVASLIGRGQIVEMVGQPSNVLSKLRELRAKEDHMLEEEELAREEAEAAQAAADDEE